MGITSRRHEIKAQDVAALYDSGLSLVNIANKLNTTHTLIRSRLKEINHPMRPNVTRGVPRKAEIIAKVARSNTGKKRSPEYRERMRAIRKAYLDKTMLSRPPTITSDGYREIYKPDHPRAGKTGRIREHIVVWEAIYGRSLPTGYVVHHINGVKTDNRPENLVAMKAGEHVYQTKPYKDRIKELEATIDRLSQPQLKSEIPITHVQGLDEAAALAQFLWNERIRHIEDIENIKEDLDELKRKWGVVPDCVRRFVKP